MLSVPATGLIAQDDDVDDVEEYWGDDEEYEEDDDYYEDEYLDDEYEEDDYEDEEYEDVFSNVLNSESEYSVKNSINRDDIKRKDAYFSRFNKL